MTPFEYRSRPGDVAYAGPTPWWVFWAARLRVLPWLPLACAAACLVEWLTLGCGLLSIPTGVLLAGWTGSSDAV